MEKFEDVVKPKPLGQGSPKRKQPYQHPFCLNSRLSVNE